MSRIAPARVQPLEHAGMRYEGELTRQTENEIYNTGTNHVRAYLISTGKLIWDQEIYGLEKFNPQVPSDATDNFIIALSVSEDALCVTDERGKKYIVDFKTGLLKN